MQTGIDSYKLYNHPPPGYAVNYDECFYHSQRYLDSQDEKPQCSFFLSQPDNEVLGKIHFYKHGDQAISQLHAPYGSFNSANISREAAERFLSYSIKSLSDLGFKQILIQHPADCYQDSTMWTDLLAHNGFSVRNQVNHHLSIDRPLKEKMHLMEQRKLSKCQQFEFEVNPVASLSKIYSFINCCRKERKQSLSLSYGRLEQVVKTSPDNFVLCTVKYGNLLAAASIVIKVNSSCWYQFYPAHSRQFDRVSPLVFLISKLYQYAASHSVKVLDLGPSEVNGQPLPGLLQFKNRLGAVISYKKYYSKTIDN